MDTPGGRIEDIGLALVVEGRYPSSAECVDLGSGQVKVLDLSTELVVLDWVYEPTLEHMSSLVTAGAADPEALPLVRQYALRLGLRVLERVGFGPLTRPTFFRIGFRDVCRDLDLHEGTSIRLVMGPGRLTRAHLDYDLGALVFRTAFEEPDAQLEHALLNAFPEGELRRLVPASPGEALAYQVRLPFAETLTEARQSLAVMRRGLAALVARFEPERFRSVDRMLSTFGERETLGSVRTRESRVRAVHVVASLPGSTVH
jgi:hypothetical protein